MSSTETRTVLLSASEVARRLNVSRPTVWRLVRDGGLPAVRLGDRSGSTIRFDPAAIDEWLRARTTGGDAA